MINNAFLAFRHHRNLYSAFILHRMKIAFQYPLNFFMGFFSTSLLQLTSVVATLVVLSQIKNLNGWKASEILVLFGITLLSQGVNYVFFNNFSSLSNNYIKNGGFDRYLVRPINPLFNLVADGFNQGSLSDIIIGLCLLLYGMYESGWLSIINYALAVVNGIAGGFIIASLCLIASSLAFVIVDSSPIVWAVGYIGGFARYPLTIYPRFLQGVFTLIFPVALVSYYPATYFKGSSPLFYAISGSFISIIFSYLSYLIWGRMMRRYSSTGS